LRLQSKHTKLLAATASSAADEKLRARAIFQLAALGKEGQATVATHLRDVLPQLRVAAVRALALHGGLTVALMKPLVEDKSPQVRREVLVALRSVPADAAVQELIVDLALQYDGYDRFYLEASLLAMTGKDDVRAAVVEKIRGRSDRTAAGWLWALRPDDAFTQFSQVAADVDAPLADRIVAAQSLALFDQPQASEVLLTLIDDSSPHQLAQPAISGLASNIEGRWKSLANGTDLLAKLRPWINEPATRADALRLAKALGTRSLTQWRLSPVYAAPQAEGFDKLFPPEEASSGESLERNEDWITAKVGPMASSIWQRSDGRIPMPWLTPSR